MISRESPLSLRFWRDPVDARLGALLRIGLGLLIVYDLVDRLGDFHAFYTNAGVMPAAAIRRWSAFLLLPSVLWAKLVYAAGFGAVICFLLGSWTRVSTVATLVFVLSLHNRNPVILNGADLVIRLLLFWAIFVDTGARFSVDVWRGRRPAYATVDPLGLRFLQLQVALIYFAALISKIGGHWSDGTAIYLTLQSPTYTRPLAAAMLEYPSICFAMTVATLAIEGWFAILVFFPIKNRLCRAIALLSGAGLHLGILVLMRVGQFSIVMLISYVVFVRREWLDWLFGAAAPDGFGPMRSLRWRRILTGLLAAHLAWALVVALTLLPDGSLVRRWIVRYTASIGFEQHWSMFYQPPLTKLRWSALGTIADGTRREILSTTAPGLGQAHAWFNTRWTKAQSALANRPFDLQTFGPYLCRRYALDHGSDSLLSFEIYLYREEARLPGDASPPDHRTSLALVQPCRALP